MGFWDDFSKKFIPVQGASGVNNAGSVSGAEQGEQAVPVGQEGQFYGGSGEEAAGAEMMDIKDDAVKYLTEKGLSEEDAKIILAGNESLTMRCIADDNIEPLVELLSLIGRGQISEGGQKTEGSEEAAKDTQNGEDDERRYDFTMDEKTAEAQAGKADDTGTNAIEKAKEGDEATLEAIQSQELQQVEEAQAPQQTQGSGQGTDILGIGERPKIMDMTKEQRTQEIEENNATKDILAQYKAQANNEASPPDPLAESIDAAIQAASTVDSKQEAQEATEVKKTETETKVKETDDKKTDTEGQINQLNSKSSDLKNVIKTLQTAIKALSTAGKAMIVSGKAMIAAAQSHHPVSAGLMAKGEKLVTKGENLLAKAEKLEGTLNATEKVLSGVEKELTKKDADLDKVTKELDDATKDLSNTEQDLQEARQDYMEATNLQSMVDSANAADVAEFMSVVENADKYLSDRNTALTRANAGETVEDPPVPDLTFAATAQDAAAAGEQNLNQNPEQSQQGTPPEVAEEGGGEGEGGSAPTVASNNSGGAPATLSTPKPATPQPAAQTLALAPQPAAKAPAPTPNTLSKGAQIADKGSKPDGASIEGEGEGGSKPANQIQGNLPPQMPEMPELDMGNPYENMDNPFAKGGAADEDKEQQAIEYLKSHGNENPTPAQIDEAIEQEEQGLISFDE